MSSVFANQLQKQAVKKGVFLALIVGIGAIYFANNVIRERKTFDEMILVESENVEQWTQGCGSFAAQNLCSQNNFDALLTQISIERLQVQRPKPSEVLLGTRRAVLLGSAKGRSILLIPPLGVFRLSDLALHAPSSLELLFTRLEEKAR